VRDTGIGISPEQREKLFKAFSQADTSTTRKFGGTGLGLVISNMLVEKMGSAIDLKSEIGKGTTFFFTVETDYFTDAVEDVQTVPEHVEIPVIEAAPQVLVAEDVEINLELITSILKKMIPNATLMTVKNGREAFEKTLSTPPDLILMDVQMPEMSGIEATRKIRDEGIRVPIIALTAGAVQGEEERCLGAGMDAFLTKPVVQTDLYEKVKAFLGGETVKQAAPPPEKDDGKKMARIAGVDVEEGLNRFFGDREMYYQFLIKFTKEGRELLLSLKKHLSEGDKESAAKSAHAIKGTAANLSAYRLSQRAMVLERALKDSRTDENEEIEVDVSRLVKALEEEMQRFSSLVDHGSEGQVH